MSKAQRETLEKLAAGGKLIRYGGPNPSTILGTRALYRGTFLSLESHGWIAPLGELVFRTPYTITAAGRAAPEEG